MKRIDSGCRVSSCCTCVVRKNTDNIYQPILFSHHFDMKSFPRMRVRILLNYAARVVERVFGKSMRISRKVCHVLENLFSPLSTVQPAIRIYKGRAFFLHDNSKEEKINK